MGDYIQWWEGQWHEIFGWEDPEGVRFDHSILLLVKRAIVRRISLTMKARRSPLYTSSTTPSILLDETADTFSSNGYGAAAIACAETLNNAPRPVATSATGPSFVLNELAEVFTLSGYDASAIVRAEGLAEAPRRSSSPRRYHRLGALRQPRRVGLDLRPLRLRLWRHHSSRGTRANTSRQVPTSATAPSSHLDQLASPFAIGGHDSKMPLT